jgi:hypothetical protein
VALPAAAEGKELTAISVDFGPAAAYTGSANQLVSIMSPAPTATSSQNFNASEGVSSIVNGNSASKWLASHGANEQPWWAVYEFSAAHTVSHYAINSANDAPDRNPADWTVSGSNDGSEWTVIDTRTGEAFGAYRAEYDFVIPEANRGSYKFYKFEVQATTSAPWQQGGMMQIADWMLYEEGSAPATNNGYAHGYVDDVSMTRPVKDVQLQAASPVIEAATVFSETIATVSNTYSQIVGKTISATIAWGDGSTPTSASVAVGDDGAFAISGTHTFANPGAYTGSIRVNDDGALTTFPIAFSVQTPDWFYQPSATAPPAANPVTAGSDLPVAAEGFKPFESVEIVIGLTPPITLRQDADATGRIDVRVTVPPTTPAGTVAITLSGSDSGKTATTSATIAAAPSAGPTPGEPSGEPAPPAPTLAPAATLVSLIAPTSAVAWGAAVKLTAWISDAQATSAIEFFDGERSLGQATLLDGRAELTTRSLAVGKHAVTARYLGDAQRAAVASAAATVTIAKAAPASVKVSAKAFASGKAPTAKVVVGKLPNGKFAAGKVTVYVGSKAVKSAKLTVKSKGRLSIKLPGKHTKALKIKAKYAPAGAAKASIKAKTSKSISVKAK